MSKKILFIGLVWPEPTSSAAGTRILQLIELFQTFNFHIVFVSAAEKNEFSADLRNIEHYKIQLNSESFEDIIQDLSPDCVLFDRFVTEEQFGWRVRAVLPDVMTILDTEDLHFLRYAREKQLAQAIDNFNDFLYSDTTKRELASILRCDLNLIISQYEMNLLSQRFNISNQILFYLPFFAPEFDYGKSYSNRQDFIFIGNCLHKPNLDAVMQLRNLIWPVIRRQLPSSQLHIYGAYLTQQVSQMNDVKTGFFIKGRVNSIQAIFSEYRVMLAPLRFGAGQKGKLIEAMALGLPSVTTSIGCEGISTTNEWNGFVSDDFNEFSNLAVSLYENEELWNDKQHNGFNILKQSFNKEQFKNDFHHRIQYLFINLIEHRKEHFLSQILNMNMLNSYKYLSKWIELKNKQI